MQKQQLKQINEFSSELIKQHLNELLRQISEIKEIISEMNSELMTRKQVADLLQISLPTLWDWTNKGIIPAYRIGNKVRYKRNEILKVLEQNKIKNP